MIIKNLSLLLAFAISLPVWAQDDAAKPQVVVGKAAPNFTVTGIDGKEFTLEEKLENKKHIVLLFSRAHW